MPISKGQFAKAAASPVRQYGAYAARVLKYLAEHHDQAFTQGEIAKVTDKSDQQARQTLIRLIEQGLVARRERTEKSKTGTVTRIYYKLVADHKVVLSSLKE